MSARICPTITAYDTHEYRTQLERLAAITTYIHVDLMDGELAPARSINPIQVHWPDGFEVDIHLMYKQPLPQLDTLVSLHPSRVIIQAEAEGDVLGMMEHLKRFGIKSGVALLPTTSVESAKQLIAAADQVLIFGGHLGYQGGTADLGLLGKVAQIRSLSPKATIAWDGGVSAATAEQIIAAGVDILDVGSAIQHADDPARAFKDLEQIAA